jgi:hypothetical protein
MAPILKSIFLFGAFVLLATSQAPLRAQDNGPAVSYPKALSDTTRRVVFDGAAFSGPSTALPQWDNGYLVAREVQTFQPGFPNVRLYDRSGKPVRQDAIWFPGSQRVLIYSATSKPDGGIIVGGSAERADGTATSFIAQLDRAGKMTEVIQTKGFVPANVCQAPDGTVWSFGGTGYSEHSGPNPGDTLRHFDFHNGQIGSYLPRSSFPKHPAPEMLGYIRCSAKEVVAYSTTAREYIEMPYEAKAPHVYRAAAPAGLRLVGFASTGSKKIYGSFTLMARGGLFYLSFDEAASTVTWRPVQGAVGPHSNPGTVVALWGADGNDLLVSRTGDTAGESALHWATPIDSPR